MPAPRSGFHLVRTAATTIVLVAGLGVGIGAGCGDPSKSPLAGGGAGGPGGAPAAQPAPLTPENAARLIAIENKGLGLLERHGTVNDTPAA